MAADEYERRFDLPRDQAERGNRGGIRWFKIYTTWTDVYALGDDHADSDRPVDQWCLAKYCVRNRDSQTWYETRMQEKLWDPLRVGKPPTGTFIRATFNPANGHWEVFNPANPTLIRTIETFDDEDASQYPTQGVDGGNVFPFEYLNGGFIREAGLQTASFQGSGSIDDYVLALSGNWIPPGTVIEAWLHRGVIAGHSGDWWTSWKDSPRIGRVITDIGMGDNGYVREWLPDNYDPETDSERDWFCRSLLGLSEANTWVKWYQYGNVSYIFAKACTPEDYYYAGDG